jgi:hypothetical protein
VRSDRARTWPTFVPVNVNMRRFRQIMTVEVHPVRPIAKNGRHGLFVSRGQSTLERSGDFRKTRIPFTRSDTLLLNGSAVDAKLLKSEPKVISHCHKVGIDGQPHCLAFFRTTPASRHFIAPDDRRNETEKLYVVRTKKTTRRVTSFVAIGQIALSFDSCSATNGRDTHGDTALATVPRRTVSGASPAHAKDRIQMIIIIIRWAPSRAKASPSA